MPSLSGKFDPTIGVLINVGVARANTLGNAAAPSGISVTAFPALVDTGASLTCVSPSLATAIGISPIGMRPMISATHSVPTNVYLVDLVLPFGVSSVVLPSVQVMEFNATNTTPFQLLIGRDIICRGVFTMSFDGHFSFSI